MKKENLFKWKQYRAFHLFTSFFSICTRTLCLNSCSALENLNFLNQFPNLLDFRFVDTNVLSGDLTPTLDHPTIRSVGFLNKRLYNIQEKKMAALLNEKNGASEFKETIKNGKYETFRYIY